VTDMSTADHAGTHRPGAADEIVRGLMPSLRVELEALVRIPSISFPDFPRGPLIEAHDLIADLLRGAGVKHVEALNLPDTAPVIMGEIPAPPGAPTVLLYGHYDVVPAGEESKWSSPPFEPTERDGALFGRGTADSKSNLMAHIGALRAWEGRPPVGIKIVIEGEEEVGGGALTTYPQQDPDLFRCDAMLIMDMGSVRPGVPTLTVGLRGMANVMIELDTLAGPKHSGQYGGAAPDALIAILHALASLHDEHGDVAVAGLRREEWTGAGYNEAEFRELAEVLPGLPLFGSGGLGSRVWSGPAITVIGIDVPSVDESLNAVSPRSRAKLNVRVHPGQDAAEAQTAVVEHLRRTRPFGLELTVHGEQTGNGFLADTSGPAYEAAKVAMGEAWGTETAMAASGGSIPLVNALHAAVPAAEILLLGTTDGYANIHAPDERVVLDEFEKAVLAETKFFRELAARKGPSA
jgi:cysteinylglycine-S-conjugate dipeptidase